MEVFTLGITAIPAVILGHFARGQIRRNGERGDGMATAGLVLGGWGIAFFVLIVVGVAAMAVTGGHAVIHATPRGPGGQSRRPGRASGAARPASQAARHRNLRASGASPRWTARR